MPYQPPICWDIAEEHLDEAAFLRQLWEQSLHSPEYSLTEIAQGPEERMLAHLDALVVGGSRVARKLLLPALMSDEADTVFAAAFALLASEDGDFLREVLQALEENEAKPRAAVRRALGLAPVAVERLKAAAAQSGPIQHDLLLVLAYRRIDGGLRLDGPAASSDATLRSSALRLAPLLPGRLETSLVEQALASSEPDIRSAALESGCILGVRGALSSVQSTVKSGGPGYGAAALLLGLSGEEGAVAALAPGATGSKGQVDSIFALGFTGRASAVEALLPLLGQEKLAPLAAEAIAAITGLPIAKQFAKPSKPWTSESKDEEKDEPFGPAADLPQPEPAAIAEWWRREGKKFDPRLRYFRGRPWSPDVLLKELESGPARRRAGLALDAAVRSAGAHCLVVDALTGRQREELSAARGARFQPAAYSSFRTSAR
jgi:uncharacterized protein (TIGR02270 family)